MSRTLSDAVTAIKNSQRFTYYDCVMITLPQSLDDDAPIVIRASTAEITVDLGDGAVDQENVARDVGDLTFSEGAATDGLDFSLANSENTYSDIIGQAGRRLYPAPAVYGRAFKLSDGSYEFVELMNGFAKFSSADGDNAKVHLISEMDRRGVDMIVLVTQRCSAIYKNEASGCGSTDSSPTCSRIKDDTDNGCAAKAPAPVIIDPDAEDNRASFVGIPETELAALTAASTTVTTVTPPRWEPDIDPRDPILRKELWANWL